MAASADRLRPIFASETLLDGFEGQPPFKGCAISADITATALATLNEAIMAPNGWPLNKRGRTQLLKTGWRAFENVADSNGIPDRDDLVRIHRAMFPGLPDPTPISTRDFDDVVHHLDASNAVSIATRLSALPATAALRQYTSADHQFTMWDRVGGTVRRQDPMHPHSNAYRGERVPLREVEIAAKAIEGGDILYWLYPIEGWTAERLKASALRTELRELRATVARRDRRIARLEERLAECREDEPMPPGDPAEATP